MNKAIRFERTEDVRMTYVYTLREEDWSEFVEWMEEAYPRGAEKVKELGYEGTVDYVSKPGEAITWEQCFSYGNPNNTYTQELADAICEFLRDKAIDAGPTDEDYYDDGGEESLSVEENYY